MATTRTEYIRGLFAGTALTTIPADPVAGVSYRNTSLPAADIESGWEFDTPVPSDEFNQIMFELFSVMQIIDKRGILGWSDEVDYDTVPAYAIGDDGELYKSIDVSGPNQVGGVQDPVVDAAGPGLFWEIFQSGSGGGTDITERLYNGDLVGGTDFTAGATTSFTLPTNPGIEANIWVYFDGHLQIPDVFTVAGTTITFVGGIPAGTKQVYVKIGSVQTGGNSLANITRDIFTRPGTLTTGQTVFNLTSAPASENGVFVIENNTINQNFSLSGSTVTLDDGIAEDVESVVIVAFSPLDIGVPADATVDLTKLATGPANNLLGFDALGNPAYVAAASGLGGTIANAYISNNTTDPVNDIDVSPGAAVDLSNDEVITLDSAITKRLDANFAEGDNQGGLDTGVKTISSTYHVFAISKADGTADVLFSLSPTAPTLPATFVNFRRIGSILTNAANEIELFTRFGNFYQWVNLEEDVSFTAQVAGANAAIKVPTGLKFRTSVNAVNSANGRPEFWLLDPDQVIVTTDFPWSERMAVSGAQDLQGGNNIQVTTNTLGEVRAYSNGGTSTCRIGAIGYFDEREA